MTLPPRGSGLSRAAFAGAVVVNVVVLYWPRAVSEGGIPLLDKVVHLLVFGAVSWTGARAGVPVRWLVTVLVAHAVSSELVQHYLLTARSGDAADAAADVLGVLVGVGLARDGGSWRHDGAGGRDRPHRAAARRDTDPG